MRNRRLCVPSPSMRSEEEHCRAWVLLATVTDRAAARAGNASQ